MALEPITRAEQIMSGEGLTPITREEMFLAKAAGQDVETPTPITRREMFLSQISGGSGGGTGGSSEMEEQFIRLIEGNPDKPVTKLPDGLTDIRSGAFYYAENLAITSLPNGVTRINNSSFEFCASLVDMTFHNRVNYIDNFAFFNCGLNKVTFEGRPDFLGEDAFNGCSDLLTINVPWAEGEVANAPWGADYATINYNYTGG